MKDPVHPNWDETRLSVSAYLELRQTVTGASRPIVLANPCEEVLASLSAFRSRRIDVDLLQSVLVADALDPDVHLPSAISMHDAIDELALQMLAAMDREHRQRKASPNLSVRGGHILSPALLRAFTLALVDQSQASTDSIPCGLRSLLTVLHDPTLLEQTPRRSMANERARAAVIMAHNPTISNRDLAVAVGINPGTASRWKRDPEIMQAARKIRHAPKLQAKSKVMPK